MDLNWEERVSVCRRRRKLERTGLVFSGDIVDNPRQLQCVRATQLSRVTLAYRGGGRVILRGTVIAGRNFGLEAHGNNEAEILDCEVVSHELVPDGELWWLAGCRKCASGKNVLGANSMVIVEELEPVLGQHDCCTA